MTYEGKPSQDGNIIHLSEHRRSSSGTTDANIENLEPDTSSAHTSTEALLIDQSTQVTRLAITRPPGTNEVVGSLQRSRRARFADWAIDHTLGRLPDAKPWETDTDF